MSTETPNYNFVLPDGLDNVAISDLNSSFSDIDGLIKTNSDDIAVLIEMVGGDTDWHGPTLNSGWTASTVLYSRAGNRVTIMFNDLQRTTGVLTSPFTLDLGYRPLFVYPVALLAFDKTTLNAVPVTIPQTGIIGFGLAISNNHPYDLYASFLVD